VKLTLKQTAKIILGMRDVYAKGGNAMEWCREELRASHRQAGGNDLLATLVAYDLQAGCYVAGARRNPEKNRRWCRQLAGLLERVLSEGDSVLEIGVGEATTLSGVLQETRAKPRAAFGFDVSWSRVIQGKNWLAEKSQDAFLFVGDLLNIPLADGSIDVVYSSHSLEPNGGKEDLALKECLRVARKAVVLVEPLYELASPEAQARMRHHGYVRGLREKAEQLGAKVVDHRLLEYASNPLNPTGVLSLQKSSLLSGGTIERNFSLWRCPTTGLSLEPDIDCFYAPDVGIAYPVLRGIPMLRAEHRILASKLGPSFGS
jgi:ubiquinone/menaquinone biosynthesis C-methylase UbiE